MGITYLTLHRHHQSGSVVERAGMFCCAGWRGKGGKGRGDEVTGNIAHSSLNMSMVEMGRGWGNR